jgi:hypothetical protein
MTDRHTIQRSREGSILIRSLVFFSCSAVLVLQAIFVYAEPVFETDTELKASSLLTAEQRNSDLYKIDEIVYNDGMNNHYTVESKYGVFKPGSELALRQLLVEIRAIAAMKKIETGDTVAQSVVQSGKNTVNAVTNLVTDPKETLSGAAAGIGTLFNRTKEVVGRRKTTDAEDNRLEQLIGKTKSKGQIASKFGVNVYSRNPVLQEELERLGWADYLGGIGVGLAQSAIPGVGGLMLSASGTARLLNDVINTTPASELWVRNKKKLLAMNVDSDTAELYLNNPHFSPALQTVMVEALGKMNGAANRELFVKISLQAGDPEMARTIMEIATMTAGYHNNVAPLDSFSPVGRITYAKTKKGDVVVLFPADYLLYTEKVDDIASWLVGENSTKDVGRTYQLWIMGDFSEKTRSALQTAGWELHGNSGEKLFPKPAGT